MCVRRLAHAAWLCLLLCCWQTCGTQALRRARGFATAAAHAPAPEIWRDAGEGGLQPAPSAEQAASAMQTLIVRSAAHALCALAALTQHASQYACDAHGCSVRYLRRHSVLGTFRHPGPSGAARNGHARAPRAPRRLESGFQTMCATRADCGSISACGLSVERVCASFVTRESAWATRHVQAQRQMLQPRSTLYRHSSRILGTQTAVNIHRQKYSGDECSCFCRLYAIRIPRANQLKTSQSFSKA